MAKAKKIAGVSAVVLLLCVVLILALVLHDRRQPYPEIDKTAIAMDTIVGVKLFGAPKGTEAEAAFRVVTGLDGRISRFAENSDVAALNRTGKSRSDLLALLVTECETLSEQTGGLFDLTIGRVADLWDFEHGQKPDEAALKEALQTVDYKKLQVSGDTVKSKNGQVLDPGAVGKGLACDLVRQYLEQSGVKGGVVSVGGSILAYGAKDKAGSAWTVAIKHPRKENAFLGYINLHEGFVSTSGDYEQYFELDGVRYCHLLDAKTGMPAQSGLCSVTVVCGNGMLSDALSTACFLLGKEKSEPLLKQYDAAAVFVDLDGSISTFGDIDFTADES